jgi:hypothetical protein
MDSNNDDIIQLCKTKLVLLNEQIKIRETISENERTHKQAIKLDNLKYELKELNKLLESYDKN